MNLRRKIALWLCPELVVPVDGPKLPFPHAHHMGSAEAWASNAGAIADLCRGSAINAGERIIPAADNKALIQSLKASQHASDAAWKAEVLEQLKAMNAQMSQLVESSRAASEHVRNAARNLHEVTEGGNAMKVVNRLS